MKDKCCEIECGADVCKYCGACLTEHNEDPVKNCPQNPKHRTSTKCERIKKLEAENKRLKRLLGDDSPYPILSCLTILSGAVEHLLMDHDCNSHGYEKVGLAVKAARKHKELIEQALKG